MNMRLEMKMDNYSASAKLAMVMFALLRKIVAYPCGNLFSRCMILYMDIGGK